MHQCLSAGQWFAGVLLPLGVGAGLAALAWRSLRPEDGAPSLKQKIAAAVALLLGGGGALLGYLFSYAFLAPCCS
jgi:hypothetical protein